MQAQPSNPTNSSDFTHPVPDFGLEPLEAELEPWGVEVEPSEAEPEPASTIPNFSKAEVLALLSSIRVPTNTLLDTALGQFDDLRMVRERLEEEFGEGHGMVELLGSQVPQSLPDELHGFPVWYVKLPPQWGVHVERLMRADYFNSYIAQHPQQPWNIGQWLGIEAAEACDASEWLGPHVRVEEGDVMSSLHRGCEVGAVIVFVECDGHLDWTGYPIDEGLICGLQAGGAASCRNPRFDFTMAHLQGQVRALLEGRAPAEADSTLTLSVAKYERATSSCEDSWERYVAECKGVSRNGFDDGALGLLKTVADFVPNELSGDGRLWLKLMVPYKVWDELASGSAKVEVAKLPEIDSHKAVVRVTVTASGSMFEAYLDTQDARLGSLLDAYAAQGKCPIAFEERQSGYLHVMEVVWPADCGADEVQEVKRIDPRYPPRWHEDTDARAAALVQELDRGVTLYVCTVLDARRWQEQEWRVAKHAMGPRGGVVAIPAVVRKYASHA